MALSNPAFNAPAFSTGSKAIAAKQGLSPEQLDELYGRPSATPDQTDRMSYEDVIAKTFGAFAVLLVGAAVGWWMPILYLPAALIGFALALVNIFKKKPSAGLVLAYAAFEGVFVGGLSSVLEVRLPGVVFQAVLATLAVFAVTLILFRSGKVRASAKATKVFIIAGSAYALFSLINLGLQLTGVSQDAWGLHTGVSIAGIPLGLIIGPLAILMAAYSLVLDFTSVKNGVEQGLARAMGWKAAFGLVLTIVWLYVEFLRLISIFRSN